MSVFGLGASISEEEQIALRKNELANLLNSYADEADVFAEIIQNAMDSVLTAQAEKLYGPDEGPQITVFLGRRTNDTHYFCVADNGLGMDPDLARAFTTPGKTAKKRQGKTLGHKGVGASFFVASSEKFALRTEGPAGLSTEFTVNGAYSWVKNQSVPVPVVTEKAEFPSAVVKAAPACRGTTVCYYFHAAWKPNSMSHVVLVDAESTREIGNWVSYLCAKTSFGQTESIEDKRIKVTFVLDRGNGETYSEVWSFGRFDRARKSLGYTYPHAIFQVAKDVAEIDNLSSPRRDQLKNTLQALKLRWTRDYITKELNPAIEFTPEELDLVETHFEFVDLFFAYSTTVMDTVKERMGARSTPVRYGIRIAVDGVPQGRMMDFSLTSNQGLDRQLHALMAFKSLTLDTGRKIPSNELISDVVRKLSTRLAGHIKDYRIYLKRREAPAPSHNLAEWRTDVRNARKDSLVVKLFEQLALVGPIQVDPKNENDTIALFCGLVAIGQIKGLKLVSLSGYNAYDGLIDVDAESEDLKDSHDPISIRTASPKRSGELRVVEFKHVFESVLEDFESQKKDPKDIDILVCWDLPSMAVRRGSFEYWYADKVDLREVYSATHIWRDDNNATDMVVLSLKHVVSLLLASREAKSSHPGLGTAKIEELLSQDKLASI